MRRRESLYCVNQSRKCERPGRSDDPVRASLGIPVVELACKSRLADRLGAVSLYIPVRGHISPADHLVNVAGILERGCPMGLRNRVCHLVRAYFRVRYGRVEYVREHSRCCG